jgi:hypothetical protein
MLPASRRIGNDFGPQGIVPQVEDITDDQCTRFSSGQGANLLKSPADGKVLRQNQRLSVRHAGCQAKGSRSDVHLAVTDHEVAVAAETLDTLVLVGVVVIGVKEVAVTDDQVKDGV